MSRPVAERAKRSATAALPGLIPLLRTTEPPAWRTATREMRPTARLLPTRVISRIVGLAAMRPRRKTGERAPTAAEGRALTGPAPAL